MNTAPSTIQVAAASGHDPGLARSWSVALGLAAVLIVWVIGWYWETAVSLVTIWNRSETHAHGYLIVPISAWLIWKRRREIAVLEPRPTWLALPVLAVVGFGWLLGHLAGTGVVQQYAFVLSLIFAIWAALGNRVTLAIAFPLCFLILAVPFGESLLPPLMDWTADFTVAALRLTGIPVYREGLYFSIPSGNWSVVEACSGLRYLIASITLGLLYAYLTYRSLRRRVIFVLISILLPIIANWVRAYLIVMIGHLSSMKLAVGVDHLIYGWVFFGVVMLALFAIGAKWREDLDEVETDKAPRVPVVSQGTISSTNYLICGLTAAGLLGLWPWLATRADASIKLAQPELKAPAAVAGWVVADNGLPEWAPRFENMRARIQQTYTKQGRNVGVFVGYYRKQGPQSQLISSLNVLVPSEGTDWRLVSAESRALSVEGQDYSTVETRFSGRHGEWVAWHWYWVDGKFVVNPYLGKLLQAKSRLMGEGDDSAVVVIYALRGASRDTRENLEPFTRDMMASIRQSLDHARR